MAVWEVKSLQGGDTVAALIETVGETTTTLATITGLDSSTNIDKFVDAVEVSGKTITIKEGSIIKSGSNLVLSGSGNYKLALDGIVASALAPKLKDDQGTVTWTVNSNGKSATFKAKMTAGYELSADGKKIEYKAADTSTGSVEVTLSGLKDATALKFNGVAADPDADPPVEAVEPLVEVGDGVISLEAGLVKGATKIEVKGAANYKLALAEDFDDDDEKVAAADYDDPIWVKAANATSAKYQQTFTPGDTQGVTYYYSDGKTIQSIKKKTTVTLATLSGLAKSTDVWEDDEVDGLTISDDVITVSQDILEGTKIEGTKSLSLAKSDAYTLALASDDEVYDEDKIVTTPVTDAEPTWTVETSTKKVTNEQGEKVDTPVGKGTWTYSLKTSDGWKLTDSKTIKYFAATQNVYATLSGLTTDLDFKTTVFEDDEGTPKDIAETYYTGKDILKDETPVVTVQNDVITLNEAAFNGKKITIKNGTGKNYELALDAPDNYKVKDLTDSTAKWVVSANGKAVLTGGTTEGYEAKSSTDKKGVTTWSVEYTKAKPTALATISGLAAKGTKLTDDQITELEGFLNANGITAPATRETQTVKGKEVLVATAKGTITLNSNILKYAKESETEAKNVKVTLASKDDYTFILNNSAAVTIGSGTWTVDVNKGKYTGKATYTAAISTGGYTLAGDGKTLTYADKNETASALFTISGLDKNKMAEVSPIKEDGTTELDLSNYIGVANNKVTLNSDVILGTSKISIKNEKNVTAGFGIDVAAALKPPTADKSWDVTKGTAILYSGTKAGYEADAKGTSVAYKKPTTGKGSNFVTIKNLAADATAEDLEVDGTTIKVAAHALTNKNVTLTNANDAEGHPYTYALALGDDVTTEATAAGKYWTLKSGKATYNDNKAPYYKIDGTSIAYVEVKKPTVIATVSGVSSTFNGDTALNTTTSVITLKKSDLDGKKVTLGKNDNYKFALTASGEDKVDAPALKAGAAWSTSSTTATLKGQIETGGYTQTDSKNIAYTKATTSDGAIATIKGVTKNADIKDDVDLSNNTATFSEVSNLSNKITVDGKGIVAFNFADYRDGSVTGSAVNDNFTFAGDGLMITPGKGDDYIKLGTNARKDGDTFVYASGDGDDVVVDFTTADKLTINKAKNIKVEVKNDGTYFSVDNAGTIKLNDFDSEYDALGITAAGATFTSEDASPSLREITLNAAESPVKFDTSFTLSKTSAFTATITFEKKTAQSSGGGGNNGD